MELARDKVKTLDTTARSSGRFHLARAMTTQRDAKRERSRRTAAKKPPT
jgi:hypothetical protein